MISSQTMSEFRNVSNISMPQVVTAMEDLYPSINSIRQQASSVREIFLKNLLNTEMLTTPAEEDTSSEENINSRLLVGILKLSDVYTFRNFVEVTTFLKNNTFLIYILLNASEKIKEYFPAVQVPEDLYIEIYANPEEGNKELFVRIMVNASPEKAIKMLHKFNYGWWLDTMLEDKEKINFTVRIK